MLINESNLADLNNISINTNNYSRTDTVSGLVLHKMGGVDTIAITSQEQRLIKYTFYCSRFTFG